MYRSGVEDHRARGREAARGGVWEIAGELEREAAERDEWIFVVEDSSLRSE